jgi:hypothetical protein
MIRKSAVIIVAMGLALAGCTTDARSLAQRALADHSLPSNRSVFISAQAAQAEYDKERRRLTLPLGDAFPSEDPSLHSDTTYGLGFGTTDADQIWWCDWGAAWMSASGPTAAEAFQILKSIKNTEMYQVSFDPNTKQATDRELEQAEAGQPAALDADLRQNC